MSDPLLTNPEKCHLARLRADVYAHLDDLGLIAEHAPTKTARLRAWSAVYLEERFGITSLTQARRSQFLFIKADYLASLGRDGEALAALLKAAPASDRAAPDDTPDARGRCLWVLRDMLRQHSARAAKGGIFSMRIAARGGPITESYLLTIARTQRHKPDTWRDLSTLPLPHLRNLIKTLKSRIASRERPTDHPTPQRP